MTAPERIWASPPTTFDNMDVWSTTHRPGDTSYTRTDIHQAALDRIAELEGALERAGNDFYEIANHIEDEDWAGTPEGCNAKVFGHFEKYHKTMVEHCCKMAKRARAVLAKGDE